MYIRKRVNPGSLIVSGLIKIFFRRGVSKTIITRICRSMGLVIEKCAKHSKSTVCIVKTPEGCERNVIEELRKDDDVLLVRFVFLYDEESKLA